MQSRAWNFYGFNVSEEDYQVVVNVASEEGSPCENPPSPLPCKQCFQSLLCFLPSPLVVLVAPDPPHQMHMAHVVSALHLTLPLPGASLILHLLSSAACMQLLHQCSSLTTGNSSAMT